MNAEFSGVAVARKSAGQAAAFAVTSGLFAIWGFSLWLYNALFSKFAHFFAFNPEQLAWTLSLFNIVYFASAVPAALFHRRFGYKLGILCGLSIFALGAFLLDTAISHHNGGFFLGAIVMMGCCGAWLDTSLNPLAVESGTPCNSVRRLNFAHVFHGIGLFAGCVTARWLIESHYQLSVVATVQMTERPYVLVGLGAILLAFVVEQTSLPDFATFRAYKKSRVREELPLLFRDRFFWFAAAALCAYTVVLTVIWSSNYLYSAGELPGHTAGLVEKGFFWFAVGRCVGTVLMWRLDPLRLLQWGMGLSVIAVVLASALGGTYGWWCMISVSFFLSIAFPTLFGSALRRQKTHAALASGFLATAAGIGSAVAPLFITPALHSLNIRLVVLLALPFLPVIIAYTRAPKPAGEPVGAEGTGGAALRGGPA